ncbi:MAG TPA: hypothetical protein EYP19_07965 [Desulfobacterales bacterium]|nr:hypothetical protein [Desulfobacterales bacterium]
MAKDVIIQRSLVEQILHEMFTTLEERDEFDARTIQRLKELAASGTLSKVKKVEEVIRSAPGGYHEAA